MLGNVVRPTEVPACAFSPLDSKSECTLLTDEERWIETYRETGESTTASKYHMHAAGLSGLRQ
jgi:hypothetical protein